MKLNRLTLAMVVLNVIALPTIVSAQNYQIGTSDQIERNYLSDDSPRSTTATSSTAISTVVKPVQTIARAAGGNEMFRIEKGVKIVMTPAIEGCNAGLAFSPGSQIYCPGFGPTPSPVTAPAPAPYVSSPVPGPGPAPGPGPYVFVDPGPYVPPYVPPTVVTSDPPRPYVFVDPGPYVPPYVPPTVVTSDPPYVPTTVVAVAPPPPPPRPTPADDTCFFGFCNPPTVYPPVVFVDPTVTPPAPPPPPPPAPEVAVQGCNFYGYCETTVLATDTTPAYTFVSASSGNIGGTDIPLGFAGPISLTAADVAAQQASNQQAADADAAYRAFMVDFFNQYMY